MSIDNLIQFIYLLFDTFFWYLRDGFGNVMFVIVGVFVIYAVARLFRYTVFGEE